MSYQTEQEFTEILKQSHRMTGGGWCLFALFINEEARLSTGRPKHLSHLGEAKDSSGKTGTRKTGLRMVLAGVTTITTTTTWAKINLLYLKFQGRHKGWSFTSNPTQFSKYQVSTNKVPSARVKVLGDTEENLVSWYGSLGKPEWGQPRRKPLVERNQLASTDLPATMEVNLLAPGTPSTNCTSTWYLLTTSRDPEPEPPELQTHSNHEIINDYRCFQPLSFRYGTKQQRANASRFYIKGLERLTYLLPRRSEHLNHVGNPVSRL